MAKKNKPISRSDAVATISVVIAVASAVASIWAVVITKRELDSSRRLLLTGMVNVDENVLEIVPVDPQFRISAASIMLPDEFHVDRRDDVTISPTGVRVSFKPIIDSLRAFFLRTVDYHVGKVGSSVRSTDEYVPLEIPIAVSIEYAMGGEILYDRSFYVLPYTTIMSFMGEEGVFISELNFRLMRYIGSFESEENVENFFSEMWIRTKD